MSSLPPQLRRSLTWDQGKEMALHQQVTAALGMPVYFCDKASPWQRPPNENTNGLLRQYFPKGSDLRAHGPDDLAAVAAELNARPRSPGVGCSRRAARPVNQGRHARRRREGLPQWTACQTCDAAAPNRLQGRPGSSSSPAWRMSCCTSWHRCSPRRASTSATSTWPTGHLAAGA